MRGMPEAPLTAPVAPGLLPRFQDGLTNMRGLVRRLAEPTAGETMGAGAGELCGQGNGRSGHRERPLQACVGTLTLGVPKPRRGSLSPEDVPIRYQRVDRALSATAAETRATAASRAWPRRCRTPTRGSGARSPRSLRARRGGAAPRAGGPVPAAPPPRRAHPRRARAQSAQAPF